MIMPSLEGMKHVRSEDGDMLTKPFLDRCKLVLPVTEKIGLAMELVRSDIGGNISRLEAKYNSDPSKFELLYSILALHISYLRNSLLKKKHQDTQNNV